MSFRFNAEGLIRGLAERETRTIAGLNMYADTVARKMETHAKQNYKWTSRTGNAVQSLNGRYEWLGSTVRVYLAHGVDYGVWLEYANERKYAIIQPTIDKLSPEIIRGLDRIIG